LKSSLSPWQPHGLIARLFAQIDFPKSHNEEFESLHAQISLLTKPFGFPLKDLQIPLLSFQISTDKLDVHSGEIEIFQREK